MHDISLIINLMEMLVRSWECKMNDMASN